jgi:conjugative transfer signal peptidase TraF
VEAPTNRVFVSLNLTPSLPVGLYLTSRQPIARGALVLVAPTSRAHGMAVTRGVLEPRHRLLKIVAAVAGDHVCRPGLAVRINGHIRVWARRTDHAGRLLPVWRGCRVLEAGQLFVLGTDRDSFDSRYFGPIEAIDIVTRVIPIWLF